MPSEVITPLDSACREVLLGEWLERRGVSE
jgi:hypothetical protein